LEGSHQLLGEALIERHLVGRDGEVVYDHFVNHLGFYGWGLVADRDFAGRSWAIFAMLVSVSGAANGPCVLNRFAHTFLPSTASRSDASSRIQARLVEHWN
jgi:hypothetical protein